MAGVRACVCVWREIAARRLTCWCTGDTRSTSGSWLCACVTAVDTTSCPSSRPYGPAWITQNPQINEYYGLDLTNSLFLPDQKTPQFNEQEHFNTSNVCVFYLRSSVSYTHTPTHLFTKKNHFPNDSVWLQWNLEMFFWCANKALRNKSPHRWYQNKNNEILTCYFKILSQNNERLSWNEELLKSK